MFDFKFQVYTTNNACRPNIYSEACAMHNQKNFTEWAVTIVWAGKAINVEFFWIASGDVLWQGILISCLAMWYATGGDRFWFLDHSMWV